MVFVIVLSTLSQSKRIFLFYLLHSLTVLYSLCTHHIITSHTPYYFIQFSGSELFVQLITNHPCKNNFSFCWNHVRQHGLYGLCNRLYGLCIFVIDSSGSIVNEVVTLLDKFPTNVQFVFRNRWSDQHLLWTILEKRNRVVEEGRLRRTWLADLSNFSDCLFRELKIAKLNACWFSLDLLTLTI